MKMLGGFMKLVICTGCGSKELVEKDGIIFCIYCQSKYLPQIDDLLPRETIIGITSDIQALLQKCKEDPVNRRRFANLILDLDPTNIEAHKYL